MQTYKRLDKLCRDMNGKGTAGYIEDMEDAYDGARKIKGWKNDYYTLRHYRYVRNQIAHEENASEESMCKSDDEQWLDNFYHEDNESVRSACFISKKSSAVQCAEPAMVIAEWHFMAIDSCTA